MAAEKNFENRVKKWLQGLGIYPLGTAKDKMPVPPIGYYEKRWGGGYSKKGLPDMHIVANGISLDVEFFQSTLPVWGATERSTGQRLFSRYFNPRSP